MAVNHKGALHVLESLIGAIILISAVALINSAYFHQQMKEACYGNDGNLLINRYILKDKGIKSYSEAHHKAFAYLGKAQEIKTGTYTYSGLNLTFYDNNTFYYECSKEECVLFILLYTSKPNQGWRGIMFINESFAVSNYE